MIPTGQISPGDNLTNHASLAVMAVFAIALVKNNPAVTSLIQANYPGCYEHSPTLYLVEEDALAETVAITVGIKGEARVSDASGFVLKLQEFSYSGYTTRSLWDWLKDAEKRR